MLHTKKLRRRISNGISRQKDCLSQDKGDSTPGGDGAVGGGILDLIASGYFQRQSKTLMLRNRQIEFQQLVFISDYTAGSDVYRSHIFTSSGTFAVSALGREIRLMKIIYSILSSLVVVLVEVVLTLVVAAVQVDLEQIFQEHRETTPQQIHFQ